MTKIFGIHPADGDLNFLKKVNLKLADRFKGTFKYIRLEADNKSHEACISDLKMSDTGLILFFCHSLDKTIRGCKIEHAASSLSYKDFNYGPLISPTKNNDLFRNKRIFCLACNSKEIGDYAIKSGANAFLGFDDIPFFLRENYKEERISAGAKNEISYIVYESLSLAIEKNLTFNELSINLELSMLKRIFELLNDKSSGISIRREVAKVLSRIKNGITLFGDGNLRLV